MKNRLTHNWGLKLGSLVFSFFLWIIVTNMDDPVIQYKVTNVPVSLINTDRVTSKGLTYEILNDTDVIDAVTITAARSVIDSLGEGNVVAVADFGTLSDIDIERILSTNDLEAELLSIPINLTTNKYYSNLESIEGNVDNVEVGIEQLKTKTLSLTAQTSGAVSEGYMIGDVSLAQNQIRISGPRSVVEKIVSAEAEVSVTGFTQDIATDADIKLIDSEGNLIESDVLKTNISTVKINVEMLQTKEVPVSFGTVGTPAEGYVLTGEITASPETILVAGKPAVINSLKAIYVDPVALNVTGQAGDMMTLIDVNGYLPPSLLLADPAFNGNISVTVHIQKSVDRKISIDASNIVFENIPEGYEVEISEQNENVDVVLTGLGSRINNLSATDLLVSADLSDVLDQEDMVGNLYHVTLSVKDIDGELTLKTPAQVWFSLVEK